MNGAKNKGKSEEDVLSEIYGRIYLWLHFLLKLNSLAHIYPHTPSDSSSSVQSCQHQTLLLITT